MSYIPPIYYDPIRKTYTHVEDYPSIPRYGKEQEQRRQKYGDVIETYPVLYRDTETGESKTVYEPLHIGERP